MNISVVITSYNQKGYLQEAIESVLNQTLTPYEIIVCDDASTDGSKELIVYYEKRYPNLVKGLLHNKNIGIAKNRSSGLERVKGDLVSWLDGDDRYKPQKLEFELKTYLSDPEVKWVYSQVDVIDEKGEKLRIRYNNPPEGYILDSLVSMLGRAPRNQLVEYKSLKKIGFFREDMTLYEDFDLCLRLAKQYKAAYCPESLVEYRIHPRGVHKASYHKQLYNLKKLHKNLLELICDYQKNKRTDLDKKLIKSIDKIIKKNKSGPESTLKKVLKKVTLRSNN